MVTVDACIVCGSTDKDFITDVGDKFTEEQVHICPNCGLVYLSPRMGAEVDEYYLTDQFSEDFRHSPSPDEEQQQQLQGRAQYRWNSVVSHMPEQGTLLEIGCSSGEFLKLASERLDAYGIDPSTGYATSQEGLNIVVDVFPDYSFEDKVDKFDAICMFHVLEHVPNPREFLENIYGRLADDGVFVLEYPDVSFAAQRPYLASDYFQKSHLYDFSTFNLLPLLSSVGFVVRGFGRYPDFPMDKNALVVMEKDNTGKDADEVQPKSAARLGNKLRSKVKSVRYLGENTLKVLHIASHNINVGDGAIIEGIRWGLRSLPVNLQISNLDIVDFDSFGTHIVADAIKDQNPDLVIVGGGGTIDGHFNRELTGTAFQMPIEEMDKLNIPFAFWGLGHNVFPGQETFCMDALDRFVLYCKSRGFPFSVRRDGSKDRLSRELPEESLAYIQEVADPGFFVPTSGEPYALHHSRRNVIVQIALDSPVVRFGDQDKAIEFLQKVQQAMDYIIEEHGADITIALHTLLDLQVAAMFKESIGDNAYRARHRLHTRVLGVSHPWYAPQFFANYREADLVIGMRGHSIICGTGLGIPVIALSTHDKVAGYMDELNCGKWCLDKDLSVNDLLSAVDGMLNMRDSIEQHGIVQQATEDWNDEFMDFAYQCFGLV